MAFFFTEKFRKKNRKKEEGDEAISRRDEDIFFFFGVWVSFFYWPAVRWRRRPMAVDIPRRRQRRRRRRPEITAGFGIFRVSFESIVRYLLSLPLVAVLYFSIHRFSSTLPFFLPFFFKGAESLRGRHFDCERLETPQKNDAIQFQT